jgi:hypothetical protein
MKKLLAIVGLLTAFASPAFAQSFAPEFGTGNVRASEYVCRAHQSCMLVYASAPSSASSAYAQASDFAKVKPPGLRANEHVGYHGI